MWHGKPCIVLLFVVGFDVVIKITLLGAAHFAERVEDAVFTPLARRVCRFACCIRSNPFTPLSGAGSELVLRTCGAGGDLVLTTRGNVAGRILFNVVANNAKHARENVALGASDPDKTKLLELSDFPADSRAIHAQVLRKLPKVY
jgi:hypothetical protein